MRKFGAVAAIVLAALLVGAYPLLAADDKPAGTSTTPPKNLKKVGDHWTPWNPPAAGPDSYIILKGDTLWDLSGRFLNNPWYWPKVWSYNPEITNPHWIYPGNAVRFFPGTEEAPARIEPVPAPVAEGAEPEEELAPPKELEDFSKADLKKAQDYGDEDAVAQATHVTSVNVGHVRHDSEATGAGASDVLRAAEALLEQSAGLQREVRDFVAQLRTA